MKAVWIFVLGMSCASLSAQEYLQAAGLRFGASSGISYKQHLGGFSHVEGILYAWEKGASLTALYEAHLHVFGMDELYIVLGAGLNAGRWNGRFQPWLSPGINHTQWGIDMLGGLEYVVPGAPLCITLDYKPVYRIAELRGLQSKFLSVSLRYCWR